MFLLIDNYDSFTYNLVQAFYALDRTPLVVYNDDPALLDYALRSDLEMVCLSPGPSRPENAGFCLAFLEKLSPKVPVLGVCLGHQILGVHAKAKIIEAQEICHGKQSTITHTETGLFEDLPKELLVGRYHSLLVEAEEKNDRFMVTARGPNNEVMALQYTDRPWVGVQFHPESVLTPDGMKLLANFPTALLPKPKVTNPMAEILEQLAEGENLTKKQADYAFASLMDGHLTPSQAGSFLLGLRMKGASFGEVASATRAALARAVSVPVIAEPHIDVVGTGGDNKHSFNCSTATSLVLAGLGYTVTKHGNRAVSSTCGSADAIEGLGLPLEKDPLKVHAELKKRHFAFLFAQNFHPCFRYIAPIRKELGIRTLFNILGPLLNPAKPTHLLLGVGQPELVPLLADTLAELGQPVAAVVCGAGIYDEVTPIGPSNIVLLRNGEQQNYLLDPAEFGISSCQPADLEVHSKTEAVRVLKELLSGRGPAAMLDMIVLNVGLALYLLESMDLASCMVRARQAVLEGVARKVLDA